MTSNTVFNKALAALKRAESVVDANGDIAHVDLLLKVAGIYNDIGSSLQWAERDALKAAASAEK